MKKFFIISVLSLAAALSFADVAAKKNDAGEVEVTFTYNNPQAESVFLAGTFNDWAPDVEAMEKTETGFTLTKTFDEGAEFAYKFVADGNWTEDLNAPDFVDDGFGGKNSHANVADLLNGGAKKETPAAKPAKAKKTKKAKAKKSKK